MFLTISRLRQRAHVFIRPKQSQDSFEPPCRNANNIASLLANTLVFIVLVGFCIPAESDTIEEVLNFEFDQFRGTDTNYGVFEDSIFYSVGPRLFRLDSLNGEPVELTLPGVDGEAFSLNTEFGTFDGALFLHASGNQGRFLYKISTRFGQPEIIGNPDGQERPVFAWADGTHDIADFTRQFAEFDGKLYFFADRRGGSTWLQHGLFRLDSADATPTQVEWFHHHFGYPFGGPERLVSTEHGLVFTQMNAEVERNIFSFRIYYIENPEVASNLDPINPPSGPDYILTSSATHERPFEFAGNVYFRNVLDDRLYGFNPDDGLFNSNLGISEFRPLDVADDVLYLAPVEEDSSGNLLTNYNELYRKTSADAEPAIVMFDTNAPESVHFREILGTYAGNTWILTVPLLDDPQHLHYIASDGRSAVPVELPNGTIRRSNRPSIVGKKLAEYRDYVLFWTDEFHEDTNVFEGWLYAVKVEDDPPIPVDPLTTALLANGDEYPEAPGLSARKGSHVALKCTVTNNTDSFVSNVRIAFSNHKRMRKAHMQGKTSYRPKRSRRNKCQYGVIASGETRSCHVPITVRPGNRRYTCIVRGIDAENMKIRSTSTVYINGRSGKKAKPDTVLK